MRDQDVAQGQSNRQILTAGEKVLAVQLLEHQRVQERQADLQHLERATLIGASIASVVRSLNFWTLVYGNAADQHLKLHSVMQEGVGSIAPNLQELDLSSNLLSSFKLLHQLLQELQHLRHANLSSNQLSACESNVPFQQLQGLILNSAQATWSDVRGTSYRAETPATLIDMLNYHEPDQMEWYAGCDKLFSFHRVAGAPSLCQRYS